MRTLHNLAACGILGMTALLSLGGCEDKVNAEHYASITTGMTLGQVEHIMGGKGEFEDAGGMSISGAGIGSTSHSSQLTYIWKSNGKQISVTLDGGKVVATGKSGF